MLIKRLRTATPHFPRFLMGLQLRGKRQYSRDLICIYFIHIMKVAGSRRKTPVKQKPLPTACLDGCLFHDILKKTYYSAIVY